MTRKYLHPVHGWVPYGGGGGEPFEKMPLDATAGSPAAAAITTLDDSVWDFYTPFASGPSIRSAFLRMVNITWIPVFDTAGVTNMSGTFQDCSSLISAPRLTYRQNVNIGNAFQSCTSLTDASALDGVQTTQLARLFDNTPSLVEVPAIDMSITFHSAASSILGPGPNSPNLTSFKAFGCRYGFSVANTGLGAEALNELMENLGQADTTNGPQTLNIAGTPGADTCDTSLATTKGWTVITS